MCISNLSPTPHTKLTKVKSELMICKEWCITYTFTMYKRRSRSLVAECVAFADSGESFWEFES